MGLKVVILRNGQGCLYCGMGAHCSNACKEQQADKAQETQDDAVHPTYFLCTSA